MRYAVYLQISVWALLVGGTWTWGAISGQSQFTALKQLGTRLFWTHGLVVLAAVAVQKGFLDQTALAQSVRTGTLWKKPFSSTTVEPDASLGPMTLPDRQDVLLGSRFDAPFLASFNHFLDYHPGNQAWRRQLSSVANLPTLDLQQAAMMKPKDWHGTRFLQQDYATGRWHVLTDDQAWQETQRALQRQFNPLLDAVVTQLKIILAQARFGLARDTVLAQDIVAPWALMWLERVHGGDELVANGEEAPTCSANATDPPNPLLHSHLPRLPQNAVLKSVVSSSRTLKSAPFAATNGPSRFDRPQYKVHDVVWVEEDGLLIRHVIDQVMEREYDDSPQEYLASDRSAQGVVSQDDLRPFRPLQQGDRVRVDYHEDGSEYFNGVIQSVHPAGTCSVLFDDGDISTGVRLRRFVKPLAGNTSRSSYNDEKYDDDEDEEELGEDEEAESNEDEDDDYDED
mmetsp:Transcript_3667/g.7677  ORF Transcript_3667/g.7677 Transcript_3667/m.7677 type:complete len:455 (-) Transcript_3667:22-1386(-)